MYLRMTSDVYGTEDFGPYDNLQAASDAMARIMAKAEELDDDIERCFRIVSESEHDDND